MFPPASNRFTIQRGVMIVKVFGNQLNSMNVRTGGKRVKNPEKAGHIHSHAVNEVRNTQWEREWNRASCIISDMRYHRSPKSNEVRLCRWGSNRNNAKKSWSWSVLAVLTSWQFKIASFGREAMYEQKETKFFIVSKPTQDTSRLVRLERLANLSRKFQLTKR